MARIVGRVNGELPGLFRYDFLEDIELRAQSMQKDEIGS
jgi:hypothetical protein